MEPVCSTSVPSAADTAICDAEGTAATAKRTDRMRRAILCIEIDLPKPKTVDDVSIIPADVLLQEKRRELGIENDLDDSNDDQLELDDTLISESDNADSSKIGDAHAEKVVTSGERDFAVSRIEPAVDKLATSTADPDHVGAFGRSKITDIAEQLENKYKHAYVSANRKKKSLRLSKLGEGYDAEDPFVDDSEVVREYVPRNMQPEFGYYYVNSGLVNLVERDVSDVEEEESDDDSGEEGAALSAMAESDDEDDEKKKLPDDEALADDDEASSDEDEDETDEDDDAVARAQEKQANPKKAAAEISGYGAHSPVSKALKSKLAAGSSSTQPVKIDRKHLASKIVHGKLAKAIKRSKSADMKEKSKKTITKKASTKIAVGDVDGKKQKKKTEKTVINGASTSIVKLAKSTKKRVVVSSPPAGHAPTPNDEKTKPKKKKMKIDSTSDDLSSSVFTKHKSKTKTESSLPVEKIDDMDDGFSSPSRLNRVCSVDAAIDSVMERVETQAPPKMKIKKPPVDDKKSQRFREIKPKTASGIAEILKSPVLSPSDVVTTRSITLTHPRILTTTVLQQCAYTPSTSAANTRASSPASSQSSSSKKRDKLSKGVLSPPSNAGGESFGRLVSMNGPVRNIDPANFFSQASVSAAPQNSNKRQVSGASADSSDSIRILEPVDEKPTSLKRTIGGLCKSQVEKTGFNLPAISSTKNFSTQPAASNANTDAVTAPTTPPPLPPMKSATLCACCRSLAKLISERSTGSGTTCFWNSSREASDLLLEIEWRTLPLRGERTAIFAHFAVGLGMTPVSLVHRARREREKQINDLRSKTTFKLAKVVATFCASLGRTEKGLSAVLADESWQYAMRDFVKYCRLKHGIPLSSRERPSNTENEHLLEQFATEIVDELLAAQFGEPFFDANNNALRRETMHKLCDAYLGENLPENIPVPSKQTDNFALMIDNGLIFEADSSTAGNVVSKNGSVRMAVNRSRPASNSSSTSSASSASLASKLTFRQADKKASQQQRMPTSLQQSSVTNSKKAAPLTTPTKSKQQQQQQQQRKLVSNQVSSSSSSDASPSSGFNKYSMNAILSSKNEKQQPPSAFFAANTSPPILSGRGGAGYQRNDGDSQREQQQQMQSFLDLAAAAAAMLPKPQPLAAASNMFSSPSASSAVSGAQYSPQQLLAMIQSLNNHQQLVEATSTSSVTAATLLQHMAATQMAAQQIPSDNMEQLMQYFSVNPQAMAEALAMSSAGNAVVPSASRAAPSSVPQYDFANLFRPSSQQHQPQQQSRTNAASLFSSQANKSGPRMVVAGGGGKPDKPKLSSTATTGKPNTSSVAARLPK